MKAKLSALTIAMLPMLASASAMISPDKKSGHSYKPNSVIVVYKENAKQAEKAAARKLVTAKISDANLDEIDDRYKHILAGRLAQYSLDKTSAKDAILKLQNHPAVAYVEPDYVVSINNLPDDPQFSSLWGLNNTGQTGGANDADIDAPEAWNISTGSHEVVVGIIDTGVDYLHQDLQANAWQNPNEIPGDGIDNDGNGYIDDIYGINAITDSGDPMDDQGHGTHVAGTIGATGNNGLGVVGVNHHVSMVGCKFLSASGSGSTSDAIKCINYMVGLKEAGIDVKVLNNSWGGGGYSQALADAITASEQADILFVAAAGNDAVDNDANPHYPSSYEHDSVLAVASTDHSDNMSNFSQWGLTSVDLGAPGSNILSTVPGNSYATYSGTSMATPHVAGVAALALSVNPTLNFQELKDLLMNSGDANAALQGKTVSGNRLNALSAVEQSNPEPGFRFVTRPTSQVITAGDTATYEFEIASVAEWNDVVSLTLESTLEGASLSADSATPGQVVTLSVPTTGETPWGEYSFTLTGQSGDLEKTSAVDLYVNPQGLTDFSYGNDTSVAIPDNDPAGVTSTITVADELTIFNTLATVNITHTYIGDLVVTLTSPSGTVTTLHNKSGGAADDINQTYEAVIFNGENAAGDWTLSVVDTFNADNGSLDNWSLTFSAIGDVAPVAPVADFSFERDGYNVMFTNTSSDRNNDIVSYAWDFGDGNTSSQASPVHAFATAGTYNVTLTTTDSEGLSDTVTKEVIISDVDIEVAVKRANLSRTGFMRVELTIDGAAPGMVDIYRNGVLFDTVENNGVYRDFSRGVTETSFTYKVCQAGDVCSNEVTVNF
ncbi:S8 family serine peptidase [Pseudoalteromonas piratica]|nr:S8 family serine peptidase [Pseudoalteromonas piratica]